MLKYKKRYNPPPPKFITTIIEICVMDKSNNMKLEEKTKNWCKYTDFLPSSQDNKPTQ